MQLYIEDDSRTVSVYTVRLKQTVLGHSRTNGWFNFSQKQLELVFHVTFQHWYEAVKYAAALDEISSSHF